MKNKTVIARFRALAAFCLLFSVFSATSSVVALAASENKSLTGEITVSGPNEDGEKAFVMLNGERAVSGRTFFSNGTIATTESASADIKLGKAGFVSLSPNSVLNLSFSENTITGNLSSGQIKVFNNEGVEVKIQTPDGLVGNEASRTGNFTVDLRSGATNAVAENGSVFFNNGNGNVPVKAAQDDDDDDDENSSLVPLLVFAGLVTTAVVIVLVNDNDRGNDPIISPVR